MDKEVLMQYCELQEEIKDLRKRIRKLDKFLENPRIVADTVRGTRKDGTIGPIKIQGIPLPEYGRKELLRERYRKLLEEKETELLELTCQTEAYIESIKKADIRIMFRLYFIDGCSYPETASQLNSMFPKRRIKYTDENVKKRIQRFFEKNKNAPQCPVEMW